MGAVELVIPRHPAKFSPGVLNAVRLALLGERRLDVLDPFAGVGRIHELHVEQGHNTVGVELQPEWAAAHPRTVVGDATRLPFPGGSFDVIATSPCYGNRMADHHDAQERCRACVDGLVERLATPDEVDNGYELGMAFDPCGKCDGSGRRGHTRNTYAHALREAGAELATGSAAGMQWGPEYRALHIAAWQEATRVLRHGGLFVLNISNHIRDGDEQNVAEWHLYVLFTLGYRLRQVSAIGTRRNRHGANRQLRVAAELVAILERP